MFRMLMLSLAVLVTASRANADAARPNIVIIMCDDMGFSDIGCFGGEIDTPHLNALAANGLRFTDFHNNAKCSETRASLLTGLWHQQSKNLRKPGHVTIAEVLKSAGYSTMMSGKWHVAGTPPDRGFDRYFGFLSGAINFFTGVDWGNGQNLMRLDREVYQPPSDFYSTIAFTDYAIEFVDQAERQAVLPVSGTQRAALSAARFARRYCEVQRSLQGRLGCHSPAALREASEAWNYRQHLAVVRAGSQS